MIVESTVSCTFFLIFFCCSPTKIFQSLRNFFVASFVCTCPGGADPKGTQISISIKYYNIFLLTLKKYQTKIFINENSIVD